MPSEYYMVEAKVLLSCAASDIARAEEVRTIIKDIWDIRMAKLRTSMDTFIKSTGQYAKLNFLTIMEINSARPLLPYALDQLNRLNEVCMINLYLTNMNNRILFTELPKVWNISSQFIFLTTW